MGKKVAVLAVNPVNGFGLFQYLEAFFENGITYKVFAVSGDKQIRSNSGLTIVADDVVANLKGHESEYDAVVFACGDAVPKFGDNAGEQYNRDMMDVIAAFGRSNKLMIGHCAAGMFFENAGIADNRRVAVHPYVKDVLEKAVGTDEKSVVDGNFYTAQTENTIWSMMPQVIEALK